MTLRHGNNADRLITITGPAQDARSPPCSCEPCGGGAYFQWPPCSLQTDPVLLHLLQVSLPAIGLLVRPPLHAEQSCTGLLHFRHVAIDVPVLCCGGIDCQIVPIALYY